MDHTPITVEDHNKVYHPKPTEFDLFVPWACKEFSIITDVVVTRAAQKSYVSATAKSKKISLRPTKKPPSAVVLSHHSSADDANNTSEEKPVIVDQSIIKIETVYDVHDNLVQVKILKNKIIPRKVIQTIALTIPYHPHLTSITINCGLRMDSLYEISKILPNSNITELCLDGTVLNEANYYILLTENKLKHLSLAKCKINDAVVKMIADKLKDTCPAAKVLTALNVSCNRITDVGAKYLADMLRTNRQLGYLNLAGNMITDEGGLRILNTLHQFPLLPEELLESRGRYVAYLKEKNDLINTFFRELQTFKHDRSPKKKMTKRGRIETQSLQYVGSVLKRFVDSDESQIQDQAELMAERKMGVFNEPFSPNNTKTQDGVVYCIGNNTLCHLNVAYNNLTYVSINKLLEVLSYQVTSNRCPRGLINVMIEGNLMPEACKEYEEIDRLLGSSLVGFKKQIETPTTKKKLLSARSISIAPSS